MHSKTIELNNMDRSSSVERNEKQCLTLTKTVIVVLITLVVVLLVQVGVYFLQRDETVSADKLTQSGGEEISKHITQDILIKIESWLAVQRTFMHMEISNIQSKIDARIDRLESSQNITRNQIANTLDEIRHNLSQVLHLNEDVRLGISALKSHGEEFQSKLNLLQSSQNQIAAQTTKLITDVSSLKSISGQLKQTSDSMKTEVSWIKSQWNLKWQELEIKLQQIDPIVTIAQGATNSEQKHNVIATTNLVGRIQSPGHKIGDRKYQPNTDLNWTLIAPTNHKIRFTLEWMDLENASYICEYDFLEANEGSNTLFKRCGQMYAPSIIVSTSNVVTLRFKTDGSREGTGFSLLYESYYHTTDMPLIPNPTIIKFYNGPRYQGHSVSFTMIDTECHNVTMRAPTPSPWRHGHAVGSVITGGRCIKVFGTQYCQWPLARLYPGGAKKLDQLNDFLKYNIKSFSSC